MVEGVAAGKTHGLIAKEMGLASAQTVANALMRMRRKHAARNSL